MKSRFLLSLPNRADGTRLPAVLAGLLTTTLALQTLVSGTPPQLPPVMAVNSIRVNFDDFALPPVEVSPAIFARPLFAPRRTAVAASNSASSAAVGGNAVMGTVTMRGRTYAVVRRPTGVVVNLPIGGSVDGWRLLGLGTQNAIFMKNKKQSSVAYGVQAGVGQDTTEQSDQ